MSDEDLVLAVQRGDTASLGTLVMRWEQPLFRFVYRMLPRQEDARDICQETFLRILKKADRYKQGSRFSTWMYQIALNLVRDHARRSKRWGRVLAQDKEYDERIAPAGPAPTPETPAIVAERNEQSAAVIQALGEIPPEQREVLVMKEFEGLKFREIAEILDCPESTVKSRLYYGLSGLRTVLTRQGITGP